MIHLPNNLQISKDNISAKIVQDSTANGIRITTFELEYPRFIHSELMTHRVFSRNAASSRAIPIETMHKHIRENMAMPIHWGKNQSGMQAKIQLGGIRKDIAIGLWKISAYTSLILAKLMAKVGLHKQIANRITESAQTMKTIVTATEFDNWFWLRNHEDAQPEIHELAHCMKLAMEMSYPAELKPGEWHVPYVDRERINGIMEYRSGKDILSIDDARMISASCCAQVSYRKNDDSLDKAIKVFNRLINSTPVHASPIEHQATPLDRPVTEGILLAWEPGANAVKKDGSVWSNNFRGWAQYRALLGV